MHNQHLIDAYLSATTQLEKGAAIAAFAETIRTATSSAHAASIAIDFLSGVA